MTAVVVYPTEDILVEQVRALGWPDDVVESADELSVDDMLGMQRFYQEHWADNAVSYTVNIAPGSVTADDLAELLAGYLPHLKGTTIMVDEVAPTEPRTPASRPGSTRRPQQRGWKIPPMRIAHRGPARYDDSAAQDMGAA